jgi:hypothetical protein
MKCKYCDRDDRSVRKTESCCFSLCPACRKDREKLLPLFQLNLEEILTRTHILEGELELLRGVYEVKKLLPGKSVEEAICLLERFLHQHEGFTGLSTEEEERAAEEASERLTREFHR